jgi:hypothetical protein
MNLDIDLRRLAEDGELLIRLPADVWLMDDHKWAFIAWETHRKDVEGKRYALIHADFHWDGVDDMSDDQDAQARLLAADLDTLRSMTASDEFIRYDSFIAPAVRRGLLSELHFYCLEDDGDKGVDDDLCEQFSTVQVLHNDVDDLAAARPADSLIFDLCLDLFNRANKYYEGDLWSDDEVVEFLEAVGHHIRSADLVTISMSFGYSGTADDTRHLAELVVPKIVQMRR